jgi:uncharacterized repeat protein (TIGR03803 family)
MKNLLAGSVISILHSSSLPRWFALAFAALFLHAASAGAKDFVSLHSFGSFDSAGDNKGGGVPEAPLTAGSDGYLYGATSTGGDFGDGTIFKLNRDTGAAKTLHSFQGTDNGFYQYSGLALGPDGNFYGVTIYGGTNGNGSIYRITPDGIYSTIYSFSVLSGGENLDGAQPWAGLVYDSATGLFYGTTGMGGTTSNGGNGTIFSVDTSGNLTPMYSFSNAATANSPDGDGNSPQAVLTVGPDGALYGTTAGGGSYDAGTAFRITTGKSFKTIHVFTQGAVGEDGGDPNSLTLGADQLFYGTAENGGANNFGCVFTMTTAGVCNTLYSFKESSDGAFPRGGVIFGPDGLLYGTTSNSGAGSNAAGTVYSLSPQGGTPDVIYTFGNVWAEGAYPVPTLVNGRVGKDHVAIYGATTNGGKHGSGTLFGITAGTTGSVAGAGVYNGLFLDESCFITITLSSKDKLTGKVIIDGTSNPFKGELDSSGASQGITCAVPLSMQLGGTTGNYQMTGLANGNAFTAYHALYGKGAPAPDAGKTALTLVTTSTSSIVPHNSSAAKLTISKTGATRLAGKLPDGTSFTDSSDIVNGPSGDEVFIYSLVRYKHASPAGARGQVRGAIVFSATSSTLIWDKPTQTKGDFPAAFAASLTVSP